MSLPRDLIRLNRYGDSNQDQSGCLLDMVWREPDAQEKHESLIIAEIGLAELDRGIEGSKKTEQTAASSTGPASSPTSNMSEPAPSTPGRPLKIQSHGNGALSGVRPCKACGNASNSSWERNPSVCRLSPALSPGPPAQRPG